MTDELQSIEQNAHEEVNAEVNTDVSNDVDLATTPEQKQEKANDGAQKAINKQHAKYREEERKRIDIEAKHDELAKRLADIEAKEGSITIPSLPEPYDEDYQEKIAARDNAIMQKAQFDANKNAQQTQLNAQAEVEKVTEQQRLDKLVQGFNGRIQQSGADPVKVSQAVNTIMDYNVPQEVREFILGHEKGVEITQHLASNPLLLDELRFMRPIDAAMKITSDFLPSLNKQVTSEAPDPSLVLSGNGVGETESPMLKGVTYE